jgi:hypothetical protein
MGKRVIDMTVEELVEVIKMTVRTEVAVMGKQEQDDEEYVYGIQAVANLLGCKKSKAQKLSNSGELDFAKGRKYGKEIPFNKQKILAFLNN